jgi:hypothetical protein
MVRTLAWFTFIFSTISLAQTPIPRQGDSCPTGTYKSGDYCKPFKSTEDQVIIQKSGKDCPTGFCAAGNYWKLCLGNWFFGNRIRLLAGSRVQPWLGVRF